MDAAKSSDGRTQWYVQEGRLTEVGPSSPKFTLTANDTLILARLLMESYADIQKAADRERGETPGDSQKNTHETGATD